MSNNNSANTSSIVSKVWAFCNTLRDDGVDCQNQDFQDFKINRIGNAFNSANPFIN